MRNFKKRERGSSLPALPITLDAIHNTLSPGGRGQREGDAFDLASAEVSTRPFFKLQTSNFKLHSSNFFHIHTSVSASVCWNTFPSQCPVLRLNT